MELAAEINTVGWVVDVVDTMHKPDRERLFSSLFINGACIVALALTPVVAVAHVVAFVWGLPERIIKRII